MMKKIIYIDMDGVLADFEPAVTSFFEVHHELHHRYHEKPGEIHGIYRYPKPITNSIGAVKKLHESGKYDLYIATTAPWENPMSATDKRFWIEDHFGEIFYKKMFVTHRKDLLIGDYLIDDRTKNGAGEFEGEHIHFGYNYETQTYNPFPTWNSVLEYLL